MNYALKVLELENIVKICGIIRQDIDHTKSELTRKSVSSKSRF